MPRTSVSRALARPLRDGVPLELADLADASKLLAKLQAQFAAPGYRPPAIPAVALQVHALSRRSDATAARVVQVIERDPMLAADILRRASSAAGGGRRGPRTLRDAAVRLGMNGLSMFVMEVALTGRVFRAPGLDAPMEMLQKHCTAVARCARAAAERAHLPDPDSVELAGLLHEVGMVAALHLIATTARGKPVDLKRLAGPLRECHVEAGARVIRMWGLPTEIIDAVDHHHAPTITVPVAGVHVARVDPMAACLVIGDVLATELGAGLSAADGTDLERQSDPAVRQAIDGLALTEADLNALRVITAAALGVG